MTGIMTVTEFGQRSDRVFAGPDGNRLVASCYGTGARPVLLVHGGGQTRHAWGDTAQQLASRGWHAVTYDQRGHGESDWIESGDYSYSAYAADLVAVARTLGEECGRSPVVIGASLGGVAGMIAAGEMHAGVLAALVLVDITSKPERAGVNRVLAFMASTSAKGFASLEEAAEAIAGYLPHRRRPRRLEGLLKNLRRDEDGRYRWHWDPRFLDCRETEAGAREAFEKRLTAAVRNLDCPVMLVRGRLSDLVTEKTAREFLDFVPHARYADVSAAGHMVAGDSNDLFTEAVVGFLEEIED